MKLRARLPERDPGVDEVEIDVSESDTFEDVQYALVSKYIEDIDDEEMENRLWETRYYIYLVDGNVERPNSIVPTLDDTVGGVGLSAGQGIALDFQENNPDTAEYICPDCATNDEVDLEPVKEEHTARPAPIHECGCEMLPE